MSNSSAITENFNQALMELEKKEEAFISSGKNMLSEQSLYLFDLYCTAVLNRSLNLVRGFISLMRDENFIAAAPLIRLHLDSLLRLYAVSLIDKDIDEFTLSIGKAGQIDHPAPV